MSDPIEPSRRRPTWHSDQISADIPNRSPGLYRTGINGSQPTVRQGIGDKYGMHQQPPPLAIGHAVSPHHLRPRTIHSGVLSDDLSPEPPMAVQVDPELWYKTIDSAPEWNADVDNQDEYSAAYNPWEHHHRWPVNPEPTPFGPPSSVPGDPGPVEYSLIGRKLQVLVKLADIVLTPDDPRRSVARGGHDEREPRCIITHARTLPSRAMTSAGKVRARVLPSVRAARFS